MANALKCDSCGAFFLERPTNTMDKMFKDYKKTDKMTVLTIVVKGDNFEQSLDYCQTCMEGFGDRNRKGLMPWTPSTS